MFRRVNVKEFYRLLYSIALRILSLSPLKSGKRGI